MALQTLSTYLAFGGTHGSTIRCSPAGRWGGNGASVDASCRTSLPDIFAIDDCAAHANRFAGCATIRLESAQNANDQATLVVEAIMGVEGTHSAVPWVW